MKLPVIELTGTPAELGQQFGESCRHEIAELYEHRIESALGFAHMHGNHRLRREQVISAAEQCLALTQQYDPVGYEEFSGIAEGARLSQAQLFAMQGLTDLRDVLACSDPADGEGCSAVIVARDRTADGRLLLAQNWDLATNNMPYVRLVHRQPTVGPETWSLTLVGCLSLIGINSEGIAVGNTNLCTTDGDRGAQYLHVLHRALRSSTYEEAYRSICQAPRLSGHYYYLGTAEGPAVGIECSARHCVPTEVQAGTFVRCNHINAPQLEPYELSKMNDCSCFRQRRLEQLLDEHEGPVAVDDLKRMLADHEGGDNALCRHDAPPTGVSTNACVILSPDTREIHACRGQPHIGEWLTRSAGSGATAIA